MSRSWSCTIDKRTYSLSLSVLLRLVAWTKLILNNWYEKNCGFLSKTGLCFFQEWKLKFIQQLMFKKHMPHVHIANGANSKSLWWLYRIQLSSYCAQMTCIVEWSIILTFYTISHRLEYLNKPVSVSVWNDISNVRFSFEAVAIQNDNRKDSSLFLGNN